MTELKISQQLSYLRKNKGVTQEELASALGVTNQAVSKWESGSCCPDITLLPDIAGFFEVSVDELFGLKPAESVNNLALKIRAVFEASPKEAFEIAAKLAGVLHEGAMLYGGDKLPDEIEQKIKLKNPDSDTGGWGFSARNEPKGYTARRGGAVFIADGKAQKPLTRADIGAIYDTLEPFADFKALCVFAALFEATKNDYNLFLTGDEIARLSRQPMETVAGVLAGLPFETKELENGEMGYRIAGSRMGMLPLLSLLAVHAG